MMSSTGSTRTAATLISSPGLKVLSLAGLAKRTVGLVGEVQHERLVLADLDAVGPLPFHVAGPAFGVIVVGELNPQPAVLDRQVRREM